MVALFDSNPPTAEELDRLRDMIDDARQQQASIAGEPAVTADQDA